MTTTQRFANVAVLLGGVLGLVIVLIVGAGQLDLNDVFRGKLPPGVAIALGGNAFPFLSMIFITCLIAVISAVLRNLGSLWAGLIWLGSAGILIYGIYISRFSMGLLLIPSAILLAVAGLFALWRLGR